VLVAFNSRTGAPVVLVVVVFFQKKEEKAKK
jgi:hypothetical protein